MRLTPARVVVLTILAAVVVFCIVQDRITAAGVRAYVAAQRAAIERGGHVSIGSVMGPAVDRSVRVAGLYTGATLACGLAGAALLRRSRRA